MKPRRALAIVLLGALVVALAAACRARRVDSEPPPAAAPSSSAPIAKTTATVSSSSSATANVPSDTAMLGPFEDLKLACEALRADGRKHDCARKSAGSVSGVKQTPWLEAAVLERTYSDPPGQLARRHLALRTSRGWWVSNVGAEIIVKYQTMHGGGHASFEQDAIDWATNTDVSYRATARRSDNVMDNPTTKRWTVTISCAQPAGSPPECTKRDEKLP